MECKVKYKNQDHKGVIMEQKLDNVKVNILDKHGKSIKTDWFKNNEIKRIW